MENLEITYSGNGLSIRDLTQDLNISEHKWDFIFEFLLQQADAIYFKGNEPDYSYEDFEKQVSYLSNSVLFDSGKEHSRILFSVKANHITFRNSLSRIWDLYHFPCLLFLRDNSQEELLIEMVKRRAYLTEIVESLTQVYVLYRDIESDVLWLLKSNNLSIPINW